MEIASDWLTDAKDDSTTVEMEAEDTVRKAKQRGGLFGGGGRRKAAPEPAPAPAPKARPSRQKQAEAVDPEKEKTAIQNELEDLRGG